MGDVSRSRRVTYSQLEQLWHYLYRNKEIAVGYNKTSEARERAARLWKNIARNLNSHRDGAIKDWKGWCKYWNDYKCKLKKIVAATRDQDQQTAEGSSPVPTLSKLKKKFLLILGNDFDTDQPGIRVQPFALEKRETLETSNVESGVETPINSTSSESIVHSPDTVTVKLEVLEPEPSLDSTPQNITDETINTQGSSPGPHQRRVRYRRRQVPMSHDAALRAIIRISERRADIEERNNILFSHLLKELSEIKHILRQTRSMPTSAQDGIKPAPIKHNGVKCESFCLDVYYSITENGLTDLDEIYHTGRTIVPQETNKLSFLSLNPQ